MSEVMKPACEIITGNMPLQLAATVLQNEFLKKSDWYDALIASINSVLHEESSEYMTKELAVKIANRLIGE